MVIFWYIKTPYNIIFQIYTHVYILPIQQEAHIRHVNISPFDCKEKGETAKGVEWLKKSLEGQALETELKDNELTRHKRKENQRWKKKLGNGRMVLH